jgi:hypothetical protein
MATLFRRSLPNVTDLDRPAITKRAAATIAHPFSLSRHAVDGHMSIGKTPFRAGIATSGIICNLVFGR